VAIAVAAVAIASEPEDQQRAVVLRADGTEVGQELVGQEIRRVRAMADEAFGEPVDSG
jgi:hypothetical protein